MEATFWQLLLIGTLVVSAIVYTIHIWPRDYYRYTDDILFQATLYEVSRGLSYNEIYTKKGTLRASIQKRVMKLMPSERSFLNKNQVAFMNRLKKQGFLTERNKIQKGDLKAIVKSYLAFKKSHYEQNIAAIKEQGITPEDFFQVKKRIDGDTVGVYVIFNETKQMYYVGQAKRLFFRVNQHFTGHGNGDVYADYKLGDSFKIELVNLADSGYSDIDKLEKDLIRKYHAYTSGYNRTRGNG